MSRECSVADTDRCGARPGHDGVTGVLLARCSGCNRLVCHQCSLRVPERWCHQCLRHDRDDLGFRPLAIAHVEMLLGIPVRPDLAEALAKFGG